MVKSQIDSSYTIIVKCPSEHVTSVQRLHNVVQTFIFTAAMKPKFLFGLYIVPCILLFFHIRTDSDMSYTPVCKEKYRSQHPHLKTKTDISSERHGDLS